MAKTVKDLIRVTGLSETNVLMGLKLGQLPGYRVGKRWTTPDEAFDRFCRGEWEPQPRNPFPDGIRALPQPSDLIKKVG
ncbi:MAG: hypothetical protein ACR2OE_10275 [Thermomicrobiales bacterium]